MVRHMSGTWSRVRLENNFDIWKIVVFLCFFGHLFHGEL